jgi:hypothetical protein
MKEPGGFTVWLCDQKGTSKNPLSTGPLDLGYAQGMAEDYIRATAPFCLAAKDAGWRRKAASEKQLSWLTNWKIPHDCDTITAGEASDLIDAEKARREAAGFKPASSRQIWHIRNRLGITVRDNITSAEAGRIIGAAQHRQATAARGDQAAIL